MPFFLFFFLISFLSPASLASPSASPVPCPRPAPCPARSHISYPCSLSFGDYSPVTNWGRGVSILAALVGLCVSALLLTTLLTAFSLNFNEKFAADFVKLKALALREKELAATVIQEFFKTIKATGQLARGVAQLRAQHRAAGAAAARYNAVSSNNKGSLRRRTTSGAGEEKSPHVELDMPVASGPLTMKQALELRERRNAACFCLCTGQPCCVREYNAFDVQLDRFHRARERVAHELCQEDGAQLKYIASMKKAGAQTSTSIQEIAAGQRNLNYLLQKSLNSLYTTVQVLLTHASRKAHATNVSLAASKHAAQQRAVALAGGGAAAAASAAAGGRLGGGVGGGLAPVMDGDEDEEEEEKRSRTVTIEDKDGCGVVYVFA